jgi:uncharacterized protein (TIGR02246 family)
MTDEEAIRDVVATWHRATGAGDCERVLQLMADDAVFLRAGQPPMRGRAAFEKSLREASARFRIVSSADVQEVRVDGDLAYCWSDLSVRMEPRGAAEPPSERTGPTLSIFTRQGGRWLLTRDANLLA